MFTTESDSGDDLPSVSMLGQNKTPFVKIESHIEAELIDNCISNIDFPRISESNK